MTDGWKSGGTWRDLTPTTYRVIAAWQQIAMAATFVAIKCSGPGFPLMVLQIWQGPPFFISPCPSILVCPFSTTLVETSYWKTKQLLIYQMDERLNSVTWNFLPCLGDLAQPQTMTMFDLGKRHWREQHKTNDLLWCRLSLEYLVSCGRPLNSGHKTAHKIQGNQVKTFKSRLLIGFNYFRSYV